MNLPDGEALTRWTAWLALAGYTSAAMIGRFGRAAPPWNARARLLWTVGCVALLAHTACAFAVHHGWSHAAAYRHTAEQTAAFTGWNWGGGLYFNYLMLAVWLFDAGWWWLAAAGYRQRSVAINAAVHGYFWFMAVNATAVFESGVLRWLGALGGAMLLAAGIIAWRRRGGDFL